MPRRDIPPYEIMRRAERRPQDAQQARDPRPEAESPSDPGVPEPAPDLRARIDHLTQWVQEPVAPALPRFAWGLTAVGLIVLLVIAYALGNAMAGNPAATTPNAGPPAPPLGLEVQAPQPGPQNQPPPPTAMISGMNYLRLPEVPPDEAERMGAFFAEQGVELWFGPGRRADLRVPYLVAFPLDKPSGADQARANQIKQVILGLGDKWKRFNGGRGDDFQSSYWARYDAP
ncbi:MAG: hypothetical protein AAF288_05935 [Planctomycetota bacterium]